MKRRDSFEQFLIDIERLFLALYGISLLLMIALMIVLFVWMEPINAL